MAEIIIDGIKLNVPDNINILECALDAGIYIPHLCHHKDLTPLGSCRLCIVEVEGREGTFPACKLKAKDGMVIHTDSEKIKKRRMLALELILTGHPADCATCKAYGKCELQMLIQYVGPKTGRLKMRAKGFELNSKNPLISHDMDRCILCGRCVRACGDLRGVHVLDYQKREDMEAYVGTVGNKLLTDANCRFCGACVEVCPTGTLMDKLEASKINASKEEKVVPCRVACPAHADIPRYIRYIKEGKMDEATAVIRERLTMPRTLGYICNHACELDCKRSSLNEPMSIRNLKRYAVEHDSGKYWQDKGKQLADTGKKVCVVGGGPTGLTAAFYLRKQGHSVTVKEAMPRAGGMCSYGIPSYRLPREVVQGEIEVFKKQGVKIETNTRVENPVELLESYDAVLLAIGNHVGARLPMKGSNLEGVLLNIDFLRNVALGVKTGMGEKVLVLGGGNVAMDCARTAKRLGAKEIHVACLEARDKMTADVEEIEEAMEEGIHIHPAKTFEAITGEDKVSGVDFMNVESFTFDENRNAKIVKEEGSQHHIACDTVIFAVGQKTDLTEDMGIELGRGNSVVVKDLENDKSSNIKGIFAAGDCIYGTKSVVMAVQSGREVASQIDKYLGGDGDISEIFAPIETPSGEIGQVPGFGALKRAEAKKDDAESRQNNFELYNHGLCSESVCKEAGRCLQCDLRLQISKPRTWADLSERGGCIR